MELMIADATIEFETEDYKFVGQAVEEKETNTLIAVTEEFIGISVDDNKGENLYPTRYIGKIEGSNLKEIAQKLEAILNQEDDSSLIKKDED